MVEQPTGEARAKSEDSETEEGQEAAEERRKIQRKSLLDRTPWKVLGRWDLREINAEELDAAILEDPKQAFVASDIPQLHFVK